jgi:DMSO reductase family type II enzyme molybdopterin subunit
MKADRNSQHRKWEDSWRHRWSKENIDVIKRGTHALDCFSTCAFDLYIKDGRVLREEQACDYPAIEGVPDFNPRGCQKGCLDSKFMYGPERIERPLKRVGERGQGQFEEISWEEATTEIADKILDVLEETGDPGCVAIHPGVGTLEVVSEAAAHRAASLIGATQPDYFESLGDLPSPLSMCWGDYYVGHMSADWFVHDFIIIWFVNPAVTRMPDAHFLTEARHNGTPVVTVAPDMNPSAMLSDYWVPVKSGHDGALIMAMINMVLSEQLHDSEYIKEQTDLPFLVNTATRKFLRESDLKQDGRWDVFYFWDAARDEIVQAPGTMGDDRTTSIALGDLDPALEGEWEVETLAGSVRVRPVFEILKEKAGAYTPEKAAEICGIGPGMVSKLVHGYAKAEKPMLLSGMGAFRWYHCDSSVRGLALFAALLGKITETNAGLSMWNGWLLEALEGDLYFPTRVIEEDRERSKWDMIHARDLYKERVQSDTVWQWVHGGLADAARKYYGDEFIDKQEKYLNEAIDKGWVPNYPSKDAGPDRAAPKVVIFDGDNYFTRGKSIESFRDTILKNADLMVDINLKITTTGRWCDLILPAASHYEKDDIRPQCFTPFLHNISEAVKPVGEAKNDWEIFRLLMQAVEDRAKARGIGEWRDEEFGVTLDFSRVHEVFTKNGALKTPADVAQYILDNSSASKGLQFEEMKKKTFARWPTVAENTFRWQGENQPFRVYDNITKKEQWRTTSGRQQCYIDHDWFLELGEELASYQPPPTSWSKYPLQFNTGHARHSMHSHYKTHEWMLRLDRGEPVIHMNPADASARAIEDGDYVEVYNDVDSFITQVKIKTGLQPSMVHMYHAWDPYLFKNGKGFQGPIVTLVKPTNLIEWGHIRYGMWYFAPNQSSQDVTVEVRKVEAPVS